MSTYRYCITRHSAHRMRVPDDGQPDPLQIASDARATELEAAAIAGRWLIARRRGELQHHHATDLRERATEASRPLP